MKYLITFCLAMILSSCGASIQLPEIAEETPPASKPKPVQNPRTETATASQTVNEYVAGKSTCTASVKIRDAETRCAGQGARLISPRELAEYAMTLGAQGIRETAYPNVDLNEDRVKAERERMAVDGYLPIRVSLGRVSSWYVEGVDFYYNPRGYRPPAPRRGQEWYWSSNLFETTSIQPYGLRGDTGSIEVLYTNYVGAAYATMCCVQ